MGDTQAKGERRRDREREWGREEEEERIRGVRVFVRKIEAGGRV
jgi:hypothetical protein